MLFDVYIPTRTADSLEMRVRSSAPGPVAIRLDDAEDVRLDHPAVTYMDRYFYRHTFAALPTGTRFRLTARHIGNGVRASVEAATLPAPPGALKLSIGLVSDLHLPLERRSIDAYRPGVKRMAGLAEELAPRYLRRLAELGADVIVLPGDLVDPCTPETIAVLNRILSAASVPCYPIIGNHEPWNPDGEQLFYQGLGLPGRGYYAVRRNGVRLLLLSTPTPGSLRRGSAQLRWLERELEASSPTEDVVLFSHFSLRLHPCVSGRRNDGYQLLANHSDILQLLGGFPHVRLFVAGHKNVPSMVLHKGIIHTLSPQLIQAPCGYDLLRLYEGGAARTTYEIDEQHYCEVARAAYADDWPMRYGDDDGRNFCVAYSL